jgi:hypothetical protein
MIFLRMCGDEYRRLDVSLGGVMLIVTAALPMQLRQATISACIPSTSTG